MRSKLRDCEFQKMLSMKYDLSFNDLWIRLKKYMVAKCNITKIFDLLRTEPIYKSYYPLER